MNKQQANNKRIAKNTLLLYFRMLFLMVISLYTSRVVLLALGVDNFGIYNVVGGLVAMFSMLSGSLSAAISRFITYELGTGNKEKLEKIFSSAVTIQFFFGSRHCALSRDRRRLVSECQDGHSGRPDGCGQLGPAILYPYLCGEPNQRSLQCCHHCPRTHVSLCLHKYCGSHW